MKNKEKIEELYFKNGYSQKAIADELGVSSQYVNKVIVNNENYLSEKNRRKELNSEKHKQNTIDYIYRKRASAGIDVVYEQVKSLHKQDVQVLSGGKRPISDRAYRDWNKSAFKYNEKTKSYNLEKGLNAGVDVPKRIKWTTF